MPMEQTSKKRMVFGAIIFIAACVAVVLIVIWLKQAWRVSEDNSVNQPGVKKEQTVKTAEEMHRENLARLGYPENMPIGIVPGDNQPPQNLQEKAGDISFSSRLDMDFVAAIDWYPKFLESNGWQIIEQPQYDSPTVKANKGGQTVSIDIKASGLLTELSIKYSQKNLNQ